MSILIKGIKMPKNCDECELCTCYVREDGTEENYRCVITFYPIHEFNERHEYYPLVEIPPHGRLIDADALEREIDKNISIYYQGNCGGYYLAEDAREEVEFAPTIIEAEEGE